MISPDWDALRAQQRTTLELLAGEDWQLSIFHETRSFVRSNDRRYETTSAAIMGFIHAVEGEEPTTRAEEANA